MKERILELAAIVAPSGSERGIQDVLLGMVADVADEVRIDALGNGIARHNGQGPHILLAAHADEAGAMVVHIEDNGFLRLVSVGALRPATLVGRHLAFANGVVGVVGAAHDVADQDLGFEHLYVDIGADSRTAAEARVHVGLSGVVLEPVVELADGRLAGRALDNRVGCAIALEVFRTAAGEGRNVTLAFTAQSAVGARGAKTLAYQLQPDLALVIDAVPAGDMPGAARLAIELGKGPAVKIMDQTAIVPIAVKDLLTDSAAAAGIPVQYEVWPEGMTDAGSLQRSVDGVAVGGVSYPARYVGGPSTVIDLADVNACVRLLQAAIRERASRV
ncbi:MAG: peptidase M42 [Alicyclobacillus sp.]|nr:peptidase M42 [Alicyclobacillus sp.]